MIQDVRNDKVFKIFIDAYENHRAMIRCGVVVHSMQNLLVFKLDLKKIFLIVKLIEALKNVSGWTTACMIQDVRNNKVFKIFIDAYENRRAMKRCGVVVHRMQNLLVFELYLKKKKFIVKLSEALKKLTGWTTAYMIQDVRNDKVFKICIDAYENHRTMKRCGVVVHIMQNLLVFKLYLKKKILDNKSKRGS